MAAQDEFYRSECPLHLPHTHSPPPTPPQGLLSYPGGLETSDIPHLKEFTLHLSSQMTSTSVHLTDCCLSAPPTGGWALNMKELKLLQTIGKGEFGGELREP